MDGEATGPRAFCERCDGLPADLGADGTAIDTAETKEVKREFIDAAELSQMTGLPRQTIWALARRGELPSEPFGRRVLFRIAELEALWANGEGRNGDEAEEPESGNTRSKQEMMESNSGEENE